MALLWSMCVDCWNTIQTPDQLKKKRNREQMTNGMVYKMRLNSIFLYYLYRKIFFLFTHIYFCFIFFIAFIFKINFHAHRFNNNIYLFSYESWLACSEDWLNLILFCMCVREGWGWNREKLAIGHLRAVVVT